MPVIKDQLDGITLDAGAALQWPTTDGVSREAIQTDGSLTLGWRAIYDTGANFAYRQVTTSNTIQDSDFIIGCRHTAPITLTLPEISTLSSKQNGKMRVSIKDESGDAGNNAITIETSGSDTIEGSANTVIEIDRHCLTLYSDASTQWFIM